MKAQATQFVNDEHGQTIVEYVLVILFIAVALAGALVLIVPPLEGLYSLVIGIF